MLYAANEFVAMLMLLTVTLPGVLVMCAGLITGIFVNRKRRDCTESVTGHIVDYSFFSNAPAPVVQYEVGGTIYTARRHYRAVISTGSLRPLPDGKPVLHVDENDVMHIHTVMINRLRDAIGELYPVGSALPVFYDPARPEKSYVEKLPDRPSLAVKVLLWTGAGIALLGILLCIIFLYTLQGVSG